MVSVLATAIALQAGLYQCPGDPNICDQQVQVYQTAGQVTAIKVEYVGWCGSMGPYLYPCQDDVCTDGNAKFTLLQSNEYHWQNLGHPYECTLRRTN